MAQDRREKRVLRLVSGGHSTPSPGGVGKTAPSYPSARTVEVRRAGTRTGALASLPDAGRRRPVAARREARVLQTASHSARHRLEDCATLGSGLLSARWVERARGGRRGMLQAVATSSDTYTYNATSLAA